MVSPSVVEEDETIGVDLKRTCYATCVSDYGLWSKLMAVRSILLRFT